MKVKPTVTAKDMNELQKLGLTETNSQKLTASLLNMASDTKSIKKVCAVIYEEQPASFEDLNLVELRRDLDIFLLQYLIPSTASA